MQKDHVLDQIEEHRDFLNQIFRLNHVNCEHGFYKTFFSSVNFYFIFSLKED